MTADVFRRLALIFGCSAWAVAIVLVWEQFGWPAAVFALLAGPVGAVVLSLEPAADEAGKPEEPLAGLSRREIERRARAARGDDDG